VTKVDLPENWDWRNVNGVNYVSPVRDQGNCGSCYAFGTMAMIESRVRIMTNNKLQPVLSTQNIVSCSEYSQGCEGGFPYLISKYGQDFQYFSEDCFPYTGRDSACKTCDLTKTDLYHATGYYYVGGHFGACSPEEMMFDVYINGPVAVSFEVYDDFKSYTGGVYTHNSTMKRMNEWEATNHAVCLVGWGVDESGIPYWTVKNSWGSTWERKDTSEFVATLMNVRLKVWRCQLDQFFQKVIKDLKQFAQSCFATAQCYDCSEIVSFVLAFFLCL